MRRLKTNGSVWPFQGTSLVEFSRTVFRTKLNETVVALQSDLDTWLYEYNFKRA